jgi:hypothetical protein
MNCFGPVQGEQPKFETGLFAFNGAIHPKGRVEIGK